MCEVFLSRLFTFFQKGKADNEGVGIFYFTGKRRNTPPQINSKPRTIRIKQA